MSQTSFTPGHVQSDDSKSHQSLFNEIQRLKGALGRAQREIAMFKEDCEKERAEKHTLRIDLDELRSSSHGTSSDQISVQYWQDRAEKAESRAEKAESLAEEAEREMVNMRDIKFERVIATMEKAVAEKSRQAFPELMETMEKALAEKARQAFPELIRTLSKAMAEEMGQAIDPVYEQYRPEDKGEVDNWGPASVEASEGEEIHDQSQQSDQASQHEEADYQAQQGNQANEGEDIDYQGQQSDQADEDEEIDYQDQQSGQVSEGENEEHSSTHDLDQEITVEDYEARQAYDEFSMGYRGTQESGPSPTYDSDTLLSPKDNSQHGPNRVSLPPVQSIRNLKRTSSQPLSPPPPSPPSMFSEPQQSPSFFHLMGKTTRPSDQDTPSADDTGSRTNPLETLGDMQEALPTLSGSSKPKKHDFPDLPKGSPQIPGIPSESTAPPIPKKATLIPQIELTTWDRIGPVNMRGTDGSRGIDASYFAGWGDEEDSDTDDQAEEQKPKTVISGKKSVAAGKQQERPSPAKEASSATGGDPPKPISTKSYAGTAQASPSKVQETAQSSRTVLKSGNAAAKAAAPQTDAPPADEADNTSGFQTVQPRKTRGPSDRGRGSLGRGEAGTSKGGHQQGSKFGQFQYYGRGGQGGNQKGGDRRGGNQGASQGQART